MSAILEITEYKLDRELAAIEWGDQAPIDRPEAAISVRGLRMDAYVAAKAIAKLC